MKRKIKTSILVFVISNSIFAQHDFGIKASGGLSKIIADRNLTTTKSNYIFCPSGQGGLFYNLNIGSKHVISSEILFSQIESKEIMNTPYTDQNGNPTGESYTTYLDYHISYIAIPIYYSFKIQKLSLNIGIQTSIKLKSWGHYKTEGLNNNGTPFTLEDTDKLNIDDYDWGLKAGFIFDLSKRFAIEGNYYYGVNNIMRNTFSPDWKWNWKIQQMAIGIRYKFIVKEKK